MAITTADVAADTPLDIGGPRILLRDDVPILAVASGEETKSESMDYGEEEFVPWHIGTVM